jgi:mannose-1-phosphate guanylyltransferase/mannose-6-phosphate isomerase
MIDGRPVVALLLIGGAGIRLWPLSGAVRPKQFLKLFGERSLLQATLARLAAAAVDHVVAIAGAAHASLAEEQAAELEGPCPHLLLEPEARDSAPAVAAGVAWIRREIAANALVLVVPADHLIPDSDAFAAAIARGAALAAGGWLVTFGVRPTAPTSEYGYIQRGAPLGSAAGDQGYQVAKFHEKPRRETAEAYLSEGGYDWNSGIFLFALGSFAVEAEQHMPDIWEAAMRAVERGHHDGAFHLDREAFVAAPKNSLDYALMEKSNRVAVVPVDFAWHDIGNWGSAYDAFSSGDAANVVSGDAVLDDDVSGALVIADGVKVVVTGLQDVIVVASPRGTFVAPRAKAGEIKRLLAGQTE